LHIFNRQTEQLRALQHGVDRHLKEGQIPEPSNSMAGEDAANLLHLSRRKGVLLPKDKVLVPGAPSGRAFVSSRHWFSLVNSLERSHKRVPVYQQHCLNVWSSPKVSPDLSPHYRVTKFRRYRSIADIAARGRRVWKGRH